MQNELMTAEQAKLFDTWAGTLAYGLTTEAVKTVGLLLMFDDYMGVVRSYRQRHEGIDGDAYVMPFKMFSEVVQEWAHAIDANAADLPQQMLSPTSTMTDRDFLITYGDPRV